MLSFDPLAEKPPKKATRDGYGAALPEIGKKYPKVVVLDADLSGSTKTKAFSQVFPERFFNMGVAEQNLVGHAAGLALAGLIPIASSFAIFLTGRAWEVVRNSVAYPNLNVKLAATHAGITLGEDGASHQIIEDVAIMRAIPNMTVIVPADYWQAYHCIEAVVEHKGPVYIRLGRPNIPVMYSNTDKFVIGKADVLQPGDDFTFVANGVMVYEAWRLAKLLEHELGVNISVINMATIKPFDTATLLNASAKAKAVFTFEEHNIIGALGSAVAEVLSENSPKPVYRFGLKDTFGQSGTTEALMDHYRLTAAKLIEDIRPIIQKHI